MWRDAQRIHRSREKRQASQLAFHGRQRKWYSRPWQKSLANNTFSEASFAWTTQCQHKHGARDECHVRVFAKRRRQEGDALSEQLCGRCFFYIIDRTNRPSHDAGGRVVDSCSSALLDLRARTASHFGTIASASTTAAARGASERSRNTPPHAKLLRDFSRSLTTPQNKVNGSTMRADAVRDGALSTSLTTTGLSAHACRGRMWANFGSLQRWSDDESTPFLAPNMSVYQRSAKNASDILKQRYTI